MVSEPATSLSADGTIDPAMDPVDRAILACKQMLAMLSARVVQPEDSRVDQELADGSDGATSTPDEAVPATGSTVGFSPNVGDAELGFSSLQPEDSGVDHGLVDDCDNVTCSPDTVVPAKCSTVGLSPNIDGVEAMDVSPQPGITSTVSTAPVGAPPSTAMQQFGILKLREHTPTTCSIDVLDIDTDAKSDKRDCTLQDGMAPTRAVALPFPATTPPQRPDQPGLLLARPPPWPVWMASARSTRSPTIRYTHVVNTSGSTQDDRTGWTPHGMVDLTESRVFGFVAVLWDPGKQLIRPWLCPRVCGDVNISEGIGQRQINVSMDSSVLNALPCGNSVGLIDCTDSHVVGLVTTPWDPGKKIIMHSCPCGLVNIMEQIWQQQILHLILLQRKLGVCAKSEMMLPVCSSSCNIGMTTTCRIFVRFSVWSYAEFFLAFSDDSSGDLVRLSVSVPWDSGVFNELSTMTLQPASDLSAASDDYSVTFCGDRSGNLVMLSVNNTGNWDRKGNSQHAFLVVEGKHDQCLMLRVLSPSACGQAEILGEVKRVYTSPSIALPHTSRCSHVQLSETVVSASAGDISNATRLIWVLGANVVTFSDSGGHPFVLTGYIISSGHSAYGSEYNGEIVGNKIMSTADSMLPDLNANIAATQNMLPRKSPFVAFCGDTAVDLVRLPVTIPWNPGVCNQLSKEEVQSELLEQHNSGENTSSGSKNIDLCADWVTGENFLARPSSDSAAFCGDNSGCLVMLSITVLCDTVFCYQLSREVSGTCFVHAPVGKHSAHYSFLGATEHGTKIRNVHQICVQAALFLHMMAPLQQKHPRAFLTSHQLNGLWLWDSGGLKPTLGLRASRNLRRGDCHRLGHQGGPWWTVGRGLGQDDDACSYIRASDGTERGSNSTDL